jgi:hypothetical protein
MEELGDDYISECELYFDQDQRRAAKIDYAIKPYSRKCTKFFSRYDFVSKPEDFMLMSRSFRCYQGGEMVHYGQMTMKDVKDYLILKA